MLRWLLLLSCLLVADAAYPASVSNGSSGTNGVSVQLGSSLGGSGDERSTYICLIPDTQNLTNAVDTGVEDFRIDCQLCPGNESPVWSWDGTDSGAITCGAAAATPWCAEPYCTTPLYCQSTWEATNKRLLMNLAYDLTGQWNKQDYTGIGEPDDARTYQYAQDHPRCDLIVSLGDMMDLADEDDTTDYDDLDTDQQRRQYDMTVEFWQIIKASGIPFLILQGNHDNGPLMPRLAADIGYSELPFYHDADTTGRGYAIKTGVLPAGKAFCVVGFPYIDDATAITWVNSNVGCGEDLPTIIALHDGVSPSSVTNSTVVASVLSVLSTAGNSESFLTVGGHYTQSGEYSSKEVEIHTFGADTDAAVFQFFSNWQELNRHNVGGSDPLGITPSDSGGIYYTVVKLSPAQDSIAAWDWSPYWNSRSAHYDSGPTEMAPMAPTTFDFDARFP